MIVIKTILNEKKEAERILENGALSNQPNLTLLILAKYYTAKDIDREQTEAKLNEFMVQNQRNYNPVLWYEKISKITSQAIGYVKRRKEDGLENILIKIERIHITLKELNAIKNLKSIRLEKLAFTLLVYAKINNQIKENMKYWVNDELKDIFSDANMTDGIKAQDALLHKLIESGYVEPAHKVDSKSMRVLFSDDSDEIVLTITDFEDFIFDYLTWRGENVKKCGCGERRFLVKSNSQKYCKKCKKIRKKSFSNKNIKSVK